MSRIRKFEIVLENCDSIEVPLDKLIYLYLHDIIDFKMYNGIDLSMFEGRQAQRVIIKLSGDFYYNSLFKGEISAFDRLSRKDIVALDIKYTNDEKDYIYVNYNDNGKEYDYNLNQLNYLDEGLTIIICEKDKEN